MSWVWWVAESRDLPDRARRMDQAAFADVCVLAISGEGARSWCNGTPDGADTGCVSGSRATRRSASCTSYSLSATCEYGGAGHTRTGKAAQNKLPSIVA